MEENTVRRATGTLSRLSESMSASTGRLNGRLEGRGEGRRGGGGGEGGGAGPRRAARLAPPRRFEVVGERADGHQRRHPDRDGRAEQQQAPPRGAALAPRHGDDEAQPPHAGAPAAAPAGPSLWPTTAP